MAIGTDVVTYLDANSALTAGTDLFEGPMPEMPNSCVAVAPTGGEEGDYTMGASLSAPGVEITRFQVMVRDAAQATCVSTANTVYALLANLGPVTINSRLYHNVESIDGEPYFIGQDKNELYRYVFNMRAWKARG